MRDQRNQAIREAAEAAEFHRRSQVLQRSLPRPSMVDVDALARGAADIADPIEAAIAREAVLLIVSDASNFPLEGTQVRGTCGPLEAFKDDSLAKARMELLLESPLDLVRQAGIEAERAWDAQREPEILPGLSAYGEDDLTETQLMTQAFEVDLGMSPRLKRLTMDRNCRTASWRTPIAATRSRRNWLSIWAAINSEPRPCGRRSSRPAKHSTQPRFPWTPSALCTSAKKRPFPDVSKVFGRR